jgi:hypothetical protein
MMPMRVLVVMVVMLMVAATEAVGGRTAGGDFAEGAISYVASKRCESSHSAATIEWNALVYAAGKQPAWGRKPIGTCRGLDTWVLSESIAAGAFWAQADRQAVEADPMHTLFDDAKGHDAFKQTFGWELPERGDYLPPANVFLRFDAKKISALFDRFYVKPAEKIGLLTGQEVYDILFRDWVTRFAREVALVKSRLPKAQLAKQLKAYQGAAKEGGGKFDGPSYLRQAAAGALPGGGEEAARASRTLGVILRRTADGTWPTVDRLLHKVVTDYDPGLAKELGKNL